LGLLVGLVAPKVIGQGTQAQIKLACTQMGAVKEALNGCLKLWINWKGYSQITRLEGALEGHLSYPKFQGTPRIKGIPKITSRVQPLFLGEKAYL